MAVFPQPDGVAAVFGQIERGFAVEVELPFVEAVEQGAGGFVGEGGDVALAGEAADFVQQRRQFVERPQGLVERVFGGEAADGFFGQVVRFVDAVEAVFRRGQDDAAPMAMSESSRSWFGHDHVHGFQRVAGEVERAFGPVGAGGFEAAVAVVGDLLPQRVGDFSGQVSRSPLKRRSAKASAIWRRVSMSDEVGLLSHRTGRSKPASVPWALFCVSW